MPIYLKLQHFYVSAVTDGEKCNGHRWYDTDSSTSAGQKGKPERDIGCLVGCQAASSVLLGLVLGAHLGSWGFRTPPGSGPLLRPRLSPPLSLWERYLPVQFSPCTMHDSCLVWLHGFECWTSSTSWMGHPLRQHTSFRHGSKDCQQLPSWRAVMCEIAKAAANSISLQ